MDAAKLINQYTGKVEYYTPRWIIEAARLVMGRIDFDPASSEKANEIVKAKVFCANDGLKTTWFGNVWLNHPFSKNGNKLWIEKLVQEYASGNVKQACCITYASTSEKWFQPLMNYPQCYFFKRINYIDGETGLIVNGVTKGSVVTYLGPNITSFYSEFSLYGKIMIPMKGFLNA